MIEMIQKAYKTDPIISTLFISPMLFRLETAVNYVTNFVIFGDK